MSYESPIEDNRIIIDAWLAEIEASCAIENKAECREFLGRYLAIILDSLIKPDSKSITYLKKSLRDGFLSYCSLDQIFRMHLTLKSVLEKHIARNLSCTPDGCNPNLLLIFYQIDKYFLKITELFNSQFNIVLSYYKNRYTRLAESISEIIYNLSPRGDFKYISPSIEKTLNIATAKLQTIHDLVDCMPQGDGDKYLEQFAGQIEHKTEQTGELRLINRKEGRVRHFINHSFPIMDSHGNMIHLEGTLLDITELRESEIKCREIFNSANDTFLVIAADGKIVEGNAQATAMYGYSYEELLNLNIRDLVHPDFHAVLYKNMHTDGKFQAETVHLRKDGTPINIEVRGTSIDFEGKKRFLAVIRDVTERKQAEIALQGAYDRLEERVKERTMELAEINQELHNEIAERKRVEEALKVSEEQFRTLFENTGFDGIVIVNPQTRKFVLPNPRMCELTGYSKEEICNMGVPDIHPPESLPFVFEEFRKIMTGEVKVNKDIPVLRKDGKVIYCDISASWSHYAGQNLIVGIFRDITEQKQTREALRKEKERFQSYLDIAGVMFVGLNADGTISLVNKKVCEISGYSENEIIGKDFTFFMPDEYVEQTRELLAKVISGEIEPPEYYETPMLIKDGRERITAWKTTVLRDDKGKIIATLSSGEDITERKLVETELDKYRHHLEELVEKRTAEHRQAEDL